jgi:hypothetical protein
MKKHRLLITLIVLAIWLAINAAVGSLAPVDDASPIAMLSGRIYPAFVVAVLFLFVAIWLFGWNDIGLNAPFEARSLLALWLPLAFIAFLITSVFIIGPPSGRAMVFILINTFLGALSEELIFRGIVFQGLRSKLPIWPSIISTSLLFGAMHLLNALWLGGIGLASIQALAASCTGMLLMAIRIRTRSLDPAILFHAAWDFCLVTLALAPQFKAVAAKPEVNATSVMAAGVFALVTLSYALFLLRKVGRPKEA